MASNSSKTKNKPLMKRKRSGGLKHRNTIDEKPFESSACYVCGLDGNNRICAKPHLVLWVKYDDYPYWPATVLKNINQITKKFDVLFFQEHSVANVSCDDCYLFTNIGPNIDVNSEHRNNIILAVEEANTYLEKIGKRFGPVELPPEYNIKPLFEKLKTEHLDEIFTGLVALRENLPDETLNTEMELDNAIVADKKANRSQKSEPKSKKRTSTPVDGLESSVQTMREMKRENKSLRNELAELRAENDRLKAALARK